MQEKKLQLFDKNPSLALLDELVSLNSNLQDIHTTLQALAQKEHEMPIVDMSETNALLAKVVEALSKEHKKEDIEVTLSLE